MSGFDRIASRQPADSQQLWAEYLVQSHGWRRAVRVTLSAALVFVTILCLMWYFSFPHLPARGTTILWVDRLVLFGLCTPVLLLLQMYVVDVIRLCDKLTSALAADSATVWADAVRNRFWPSRATARPEDLDGPPSHELLVTNPSWRTAIVGVATLPVATTSNAIATDQDVSYWLDIRFTAEWTARLSWLVYLPFIVICLIIVSRNRFFDDWDTPPGLYIGFGISLAYIVGCVLVLMRRAARLRSHALRPLRQRERALLAAGTDSTELARVKVMIEHVERTDEGAFAPFTQQPIFGAVAVMFGGAGIGALLQYLTGIR